MSQKTRKLIVYMTLPVAIIWAVLNYPGDKTASPPAVQTVQPKAQAKVSALAPSKPDTRLINIEDKKAAEWGIDPFRTYLYNGEAPPSVGSVAWILKGIVYNPEQPLAFINNQSVRVGDEIEGATVLSITKKSVVVIHDGEEITLTVNKG